MADELPRWSDIASRPDFLAADTATKEATRLNYRNELARMSFLAGGDEKAVADHLSKFDEISKPTIQRTANDTPAKTAAVAMQVASARARQQPLTAAEIAAASQPAMVGFNVKPRADAAPATATEPIPGSAAAIATDWGRNVATVAAKATTGMGKALYGAADLVSRYPVVGGGIATAGTGGIDSALRKMGIAPDFERTDKAIDANVASPFYRQQQEALSATKGAPTALQEQVAALRAAGRNAEADALEASAGVMEKAKRIGNEAVANAKYLINNPDFAVLKAVETIPQMLASVATGQAVATKSAAAIATAAEQTALKAGLSKGMASAAGEKAAADWLASKAADKAVRVAGSGTEAGLAVGGAAQSIREKLDDFEVPTEVDGKKRKLTEDEKARAMAVADTYLPVVGLTGVISYALGGMESSLIRNAVGKQLTKIADKPVVARPGAMVKNGFNEAGEEVLQAFPEQMGQNLSEKTFNKKKDISEGVGANAGQSGVLGGMMGAGHAAIQGGAGKRADAVTPATAAVIPGRDAVIQPELPGGSSAHESPVNQGSQKKAEPKAEPVAANSGSANGNSGTVIPQVTARPAMDVPPMRADALDRLHQSGARDAADLKDFRKPTQTAPAEQTAPEPDVATPLADAARLESLGMAPGDVGRPDNGEPFANKRAATMALGRMRKADPTVALEPVQVDIDRNYWALRPVAKQSEQLSADRQSQQGLQPENGNIRQTDKTAIEPSTDATSSEKPLPVVGSPSAPIESAATGQQNIAPNIPTQPDAPASARPAGAVSAAQPVEILNAQTVAPVSPERESTEQAIARRLRKVADSVESMGTNNGARALDERWAAGAIVRNMSADGTTAMLREKFGGKLAAVKIALGKGQLTPNKLRAIARTLDSGGDSQDIYSASGEPFKTEKAAQLSSRSRGMTGTHAVTPTDGGYVLRPVSEQTAPSPLNDRAEPTQTSQETANVGNDQGGRAPVRDNGAPGDSAAAPNRADGQSQRAANDGAPQGGIRDVPAGTASTSGTGVADAAKSKRNGAGVKRAKKEPTLIAAIKAAGGLRSEFARDLTGETPRRANQMYPFAFRRNGVDLSTMVHNGLLDDFLPPNLRSDVFNTPDAPANPDEAIAYIEDAIRNGEAAHLRSWDTQMALAQDAMTERQLESVADEISDEMSQAEIEHEIAVLAATNKELNEVANAEADQYAEQQSHASGETAQAQSEDSSGDPGARTGDAQDQGRASEVDRPSLELTGQTEGQIRGEEAQRAKQEADQRARDNAPSPDDFTLTGSDRAADVGAARGQNSLFEPQSEYGQRDLFADEVPDSQRANLVERVSSARSDGINAKTAVNRAEQRTLPGRYSTGVRLDPGAVRDSAVASVHNLQDAALATSSLVTLVREHIDVVVTDGAGKILAVQRMFGGATSQAAAYPQEIIKFVTAIKGAAAFYVAHNHPSDNYALSQADRRLSDAIGAAAKGIAPEYRGIVSVTTQGYAGYSVDGVDESGPFRKTEKKHRIRYLEETVEKRGYLGPVINAPEIAKTIVPEIAQGQQGIVFLDTQHRPTGFFPVRFDDATKLLDGELARDIVAAAYRSRAHSAMMATQDYTPGPYVSFATSARDGVRNVGALLARIEVRALDAINSRGDSRAMTGDPIVGDALFQRSKPAPAPLWRSALSEAVGKTPFQQAPADQWKAWLNSNAAKLGVKKDEIEWSGITDWLDLQQGKVSREQVQQYLAQNGVKVTETELGDEATDVAVQRWLNERAHLEFARPFESLSESDQDYLRGKADDANITPQSQTKYAQYALPGGENYRELLLTLPQANRAVTYVLVNPETGGKIGDFATKLEAEQYRDNGPRDDVRAFDVVPQNNGKEPGYKSSHWDQPNILAHIRFNERTDADGKRVLFIEEIQSDWGQEGKKKGFASKAASAEKVGPEKTIPGNGLRDRHEQAWRVTMQDGSVEDRMLPVGVDPMAGAADRSGPPLAPYIGKTEAWVSLALKRMIRYAVDGGFDRIAMVTGEQSAERYDLSKSINELEYMRFDNGRGQLKAFDHSGKQVISKGVSDDQLPDIIGKDAAQKLLDSEGVEHRTADAKVHTLKGQDLKVGGEGMKAFYDKIVPNVANDVLKKLGGGKVDSGSVSGGKIGWTVQDKSGRVLDGPFDDRNEAEAYAFSLEMNGDYGKVVSTKNATIQQPGFDITDKMREQAAQGMPLFQRGAEQQASFAASPAGKKRGGDAGVQRQVPGSSGSQARGAQQEVTGMDPRAVRGIVDLLTGGWKNAPKIEVIASMNDAPAAILRQYQIANDAGAQGEARGFLDRATGTVYVVASAARDAETVFSTVFHEALGHHGLRGVFGSALNKVLDDVAERRAADVARKAIEYGLLPEGVKATDGPHKIVAALPEDIRRDAAEEVLAEIAEKYPNIPAPGLIRRAIAAIRRWLVERFPTLRSIRTLTDADIIRDYIVPARDWVQRGREALTGGDGAVVFQRAYHGSPHKFDKFSLDKIGTGEGAQAYGYGLYFASKKEIAEHYRSTLAASTVSTQDGALGVNGLADALVKRAAPAPQLEAATRSKAVQIATAIIVNGKSAAEVAADIRASRYAQTYSALADALEAMGADKTRGQLYTVDIPEDSEMLDWDKPLSEQPEGVRKAIKRRMPDMAPFNGLDMGSNATLLDNRDGQADQTSSQPWILRTQSNNGTSNFGLTQKDVDRMLGSRDVDDLKGQQIYTRLAAQKGSQQAASEYLNSMGIRGIKYLDGNSRTAKDGSHNYVIFDDKDVQITDTAFSRAKTEGMATKDVVGNQSGAPADDSMGGEYKIEHRPMQDAGGAARLHDLTASFPEDIYGSNALQYYGSGDQREASVLRILRSLRGKPDATVKIYRGAPASASGINTGDWVTLNHSVAQDYADQLNDGKVFEKEVKAKDVTAWGDSLLEYGYFPNESPTPNSSAFSREAGREARAAISAPSEHEGYGFAPTGGMQERAVRAEKSGSPEPAQKSKAAASEANDTTKYRIVDVFGHGKRLDYYDDARGLMYIRQEFPSGKVGWDPREIIDGHDFSLMPTTQNYYPSLDAAVAAVRGLRIGNALRARNNALYGDIPNTWSGEPKKVAKALVDAGFVIDEFSRSSQSTSKYIYLRDGIKVRLSDHDLPGHYEGSDVEFRYGGSIPDLIQRIKNASNESPTPDSSGVAFSRKLPDTIEVDGKQRPTTYTTYRGVSHEGPNDYGVAGNGEYSSGRRQVAESYAGKDGKVESRTVTLNNPLSLTYAELNDLQTKLYGKPLTGFEKGLSDKFDAWLRSQGHDGVVLFDPEISKTVPEEVVRLADNADLASSGGVLFQRAKLIDQVSKVIQNEPTFNFLNKSLNTQAFKAWKSPEFRRVYDRVQTYIKDTARFAHESASLAPNLLPAWDRMLGVNGVLSGSAIKRDLTGQTARERRKVGAAVFAGTLNDKRTYTDAELRERFKLNEREIRMYREALTSAHASLDALAVSSLSKIASTVGVRQDVRGMDLLAAHEALSAAVEATKSKAAPQVLSDMDEVASRVADLKDEAYFPLMRFGDYTLTVRDKQGDVKLFRMYESKGARDTDLQAVRTDPEFKGMQVTTGTKANVANELYKGLSPDALEVFAKSIGASDQAVFQDYLRIAVANRSAMKRLIHRKGIAGFDEDVTRTLSNFITSNARLTSRNYHWAEALKDAAAIPQEKGDVADEAAKLLTYVADNKEEAGFIRNLMFVNFLGGSIASAALNATQPFVVTAPYLSQWGGGLEVGKALAVLTKTAPKSPELAAAMKRATEEGVIAPHEIHNLYAESDNGWMDRLHIPESAQIGVRRGLLLWGAAFAAAESFNRQAAFIAGYSTYQNMTPEQKAALRDEGVSDAYKFAEKTVDDTQFVYNKGARPNWARGAVGATLFTFKTFTVSMLEVIGKASPKAKALIGAALILVAGIKGLPFEEDAEDIIDTIGQALGYRTNSGKEIELAAYKLLGQTLGGLLLHGVTGTGAAPFDVSQRMGMANIIPGTGVFLQSKDANAKMKEVAEAFGAFGGLVTQAMRMIDGIQSRGIGAGLAEGAPTAIANVIKAVDMADKGMYRDSKGRKVVDTTPMDAVVKAFGAQPAKVAKEQRALGMVADDAALIRNVTKDIVDKMARAQFDRMHATDAAKAALADKSMAEAEAEMTQWNKRNPEAGITIRGQDVAKRVQEMERDKELRTIKNAPRGMREDAMNTLRQLRQ